MSKRLTTSEFIKRSRQVHGDRYDYSNSVYVDAGTKIIIICPEHGEFRCQQPSNHWQGNNCPQCVAQRRSDTARARNANRFLKKAKEIHGEKYDYSLVDYRNAKSRVLIVCPQHGRFELTPNRHLAGRGCRNCTARKPITNREDFIKFARKIHGEKYDYSRVVYVDPWTPVEIICPEHGDFWQITGNHLSNRSGCPLCGGRERVTTKVFVRKARRSSSEFSLDYSQVNYKGANPKVIIVCKIHGPFLQSPDAHLNHKSGCPDCKGSQRSSTEKFVKKARAVHGENYDYSETKYRRNNVKVRIICPTHGVFEMTPTSHLSGSGCYSCAGYTRRTTDSFIDEATQLHGDRFECDLVEYSHVDTPVTFRCVKHGEFRTTPYIHLKGDGGCPQCLREKLRAVYSKSTEQFVEEAKSVHDNVYDYSQVIYVNSREKVRIICPEHGAFWQSAGSHLMGCGCPDCSGYGIDVNAPGILYYLRFESRNFLFGRLEYPIEELKDRFKGRDAKNITVIRTWSFERLGDALRREQELLREHEDFRYTRAGKNLTNRGRLESYLRVMFSGSISLNDLAEPMIM